MRETGNGALVLGFRYFGLMVVLLSLRPRAIDPGNCYEEGHDARAKAESEDLGALETQTQMRRVSVPALWVIPESLSDLGSS